MEPWLVILIIAAAALLIPVVWVIAIFNRYVRLRQHIKESWADIDVELRRRYDLIPNLVETVRGYAQHEQDTLAKVIEARNKAASPHATQTERGVDETTLMLGVKKLFALAEAYPELRADEHFLALQRELSLTEDRIAASRRFYNANVREMNQLRGSFPTNVVGSLFGFENGSFFELSSDAERVVPRIAI